jgi:hypothetical protein
VKRTVTPCIALLSLASVATMCGTEQHHHTTSMPVVYASTTTTTGTPTTTTYLPSTTTTTIDPTVFAQWSRVALCENGGWLPPRGAAYPDSLGISAANWRAYGGGDDLAPANQIRVAQAIEAAAGLVGYVPDQHGCASW